MAGKVVYQGYNMEEILSIPSNNTCKLTIIPGQDHLTISSGSHQEKILFSDIIDFKIEPEVTVNDRQGFGWGHAIIQAVNGRNVISGQTLTLKKQELKWYLLITVKGEDQNPVEFKFYEKAGLGYNTKNAKSYMAHDFEKALKAAL